MAFHKCTAPGCAFSLPDRYPLGRCPWHMVPSSNVHVKALLALAGIVVLGAGYAVALVKDWRQTARESKDLENGQAEWRRRGATRGHNPGGVDEPTTGTTRAIR